MRKINLKYLYPEIYIKDKLVEVTDEVYAVLRKKEDMNMMNISALNMN